MSQQILSITQINEYIRMMMDGDRLLCSVAVRGEISTQPRVFSAPETHNPTVPMQITRVSIHKKD